MGVSCGDSASLLAVGRGNKPLFIFHLFDASSTFICTF